MSNSVVRQIVLLIVVGTTACSARTSFAQVPDTVANLQVQAVQQNQSNWGYWGPNPDVYSSWKTHSNRLIPVYTFGIGLDAVKGENSVYRNEVAIKKLYGEVPEQTLNPQAEYFDQTDIYRLQQSAVAAGKKRVILFVFDGMDWQTTRAAAISRAGAVSYDSGRGKGLAFIDYRGVETDFGYFVTSPHNEGTSVNVDKQTVTNAGGKLRGGYAPKLCGSAPWDAITDADYPIGKGKTLKHAYTDSASSATSLTSGIKTYNNAINVDATGAGVLPIARSLQEQGFAIGVVSSVPISHATPACAYANNVHRSDYQDITRDMVGLPSVFNVAGLPGVDVLIGAGWGEEKEKDAAQGDNFVAGNKYMTAEDLSTIDVNAGGKYVVAQRTNGVSGLQVLNNGVKEAIKKGHKLFGYFGVGAGHLPFQTANGDYQPVISFGTPKPEKAEVYSQADLEENVKLKDMALAAVEVLNSRSENWWLMIEAGDVDWANHSNNIDNSIGAVLSGDDAFASVVSWIEQNGGWQDTALILTADHGHYLNLKKPEALIAPKSAAAE